MVEEIMWDSQDEAEAERQRGMELECSGCFTAFWSSLVFLKNTGKIWL